MSKFKFVSENRAFVDGEASITTKEFDAEYLYEVLEEFENFLRGCGYVFKGQLDFVEDDEESCEAEGWPTPLFDDKDELGWPTMNDQSPLFDDTITLTGSSKK
jgi:hypothetical protein